MSAALSVPLELSGRTATTMAGAALVAALVVVWIGLWLALVTWNRERPSVPLSGARGGDPTSLTAWRREAAYGAARSLARRSDWLPADDDDDESKIGWIAMELMVQGHPTDLAKSAARSAVAGEKGRYLRAVGE